MILRDEVTLSPSHHVQSYNIRLKLQTECIKKRDYFVFFLFKSVDWGCFGGFLHYLLFVFVINFLSLVDDAAVLSS